MGAAREILARTGRLLEQTIVVGRRELGAVHLGYVLSAAYDTMPRLIGEVKERHSALQIEVREGWSLELDKALTDGALDLVVSDTLPDRIEHGRQPPRQESFIAARRRALA